MLSESTYIFLPQEFSISTWEALEPHFQRLLDFPIENKAELEDFLRALSEVDAMLDEDMAWRYIRMTCDTQNEALVAHYQDFVQNILPPLTIWFDKFNRKIMESPFVEELDAVLYKTYLRSLKTEIELYRDENVPLMSDEQTLAQEYGALAGKMSIEHEGKTITLQQASRYLEGHDRAEREAVWKKVNARRAQDTEAFDQLFDQLLAVRKQIAENCGFSSFTDYKFQRMGRFDYARKDCEDFHQSVEEVVKPICEELLKERQTALGLESLRPWDLSVDYLGKTPLRPFETGRELVDKSIEALSRLSPELGDVLKDMDKRNFLDVESRVGKAPGGYNYPLAETGVPFIFMNAAGTHRDVTTMLHEAGHAVHAVVSHPIPLNQLKRVPSEVAEVASMTMELLTIDQYDLFYANESHRKRAQKEQIIQCLTGLPWIACVDAFQMWIYDNPSHSRAERSAAWTRIYKRFHGEIVNWEGLEAVRDNMWMRQLHIFEVPFYYIEYAFAQLGALAIWRNFRQEPQKALNQYLDALKLGYTRTIPELYEAAGVKFDFSPAYVKELADFALQAYKNISY